MPRKKQTPETLPISEVLPDPQNARRRTERSSYMIAKSLEQFGPLRSLVGKRLPDGRVVVMAGNGTLEEAGQLGIEKVRLVERNPDELVVVVADGLTDEQWQQYAIADNRASDESGWDAELLAQIDQAIDLSDWFREGEIEGLLEAMGDDAAVEIPDESPPGSTPPESPCVCPACGHEFVVGG